MEINYDSPNEIADFLKMRGIWLKKRFGQNFLINPGIRKHIIDLLQIECGTRVWEIGPGLGQLTSGILDKGADLTVFEIDRGLVRVLEELFSSNSRFHIISGDVMDTWKTTFTSTGTPDRVVGNLPYSSGSAIIASFIEGGLIPERSVLTVQKEQAERMAASPGSSSYSSFSVLCNYAFKIRQEGDIKAGSFFPKPEVTSRVLVLVPNRDIHLENRELFFSLTRDLFHARRKTIRNNLESGSLIRRISRDTLFSALEECGISPAARAETLPVEVIASCADTIGKACRIDS